MRRLAAVAAGLAVTAGVWLWARGGRSVLRLAEQDLIWNVLAAGPVACAGEDVARCAAAAGTPKLVYDGRELAKAAVPAAGPREATFMILRARVPAEMVAAAAEGRGWGGGPPSLELPPYPFVLADVAVNGRPAGRFRAGERLLVPLVAADAGKDLNVTAELAVRGP